MVVKIRNTTFTTKIFKVTKKLAQVFLICNFYHPAIIMVNVVFMCYNRA